MRAIIVVYVASIVYSVVRYVAFAPKNVEHIPAFIVNKGVSMAAAICFAVAFWTLAREAGLRRRTQEGIGHQASGIRREQGAAGGSWQVAPGADLRMPDAGSQMPLAAPALTPPTAPTAPTASARWFRAGVFGVIWHIPVSLAILRPSYFKEFFLPAPKLASDAAGGVSGAAGGAGAQPGVLTDALLAQLSGGPRMSTAGEMVFMFGGLATALLFLNLRPPAFITPIARWWLSLAFMLCLTAHVASMGYSRGLNINITHAYLPPMWLLSVIALGLGVVYVLLTRPRGRG
jgi:hypothetical protein